MAQWDEIFLKHNSYFHGPALSRNISFVSENGGAQE